MKPLLLLCHGSDSPLNSAQLESSQWSTLRLGDYRAALSGLELPHPALALCIDDGFPGAVHLFEDARTSHREATRVLLMSEHSASGSMMSYRRGTVFHQSCPYSDPERLKQTLERSLEHFNRILTDDSHGFVGRPGENGLFNTAILDLEFARMVDGFQRYPHPFALFYFHLAQDIRSYKAKIVELIQSHCREWDLLASIAAGSWVLLAEKTSGEEAQAIAMRFSRSLCNLELKLGMPSKSLGLSFGLYPTHGKTLEAILNHLDAVVAPCP